MEMLAYGLRTARVCILCFSSGTDAVTHHGLACLSVLTFYPRMVCAWYVLSGHRLLLVTGSQDSSFIVDATRVRRIPMELAMEGGRNFEPYGSCRRPRSF